MAYQLISGGLNDCILAAGFERMEKGSLTMKFADRENPLSPLLNQTDKIVEKKNEKLPFAPRIFGNAGIEHMNKYGTKPEHFAKIGYKNHLHSVNNPYS